MAAKNSGHVSTHGTRAEAPVLRNHARQCCEDGGGVKYPAAARSALLRHNRGECPNTQESLRFRPVVPFSKSRVITELSAACDAVVVLIRPAIALSQGGM